MEDPENGRPLAGPPSTSAAAEPVAPASPRRDQRGRTEDGPLPRGRQDGKLSGRPDGPTAVSASSPFSDPGSDGAPAVPRPRIGDTRPAPPSVRPVTGNVVPARGAPPPAAPLSDAPAESDGEARAPSRRGRRRRGSRDRRRSTGRYLICVHVQPGLSQIAVLEGRSLVQHFVSRAADETSQIDGNIYLGRVQNVLPGMEAAFVDIGIPKNAVLYRGDVRYDRDDIEGGGGGSSAQPRIEDVLKAGQTILCQVTKNPIGAKGARLTQDVSLPGRFAVLVPNSSAFGISKRLGDTERRRLRRIIDEVKPAGHGMIVRTAAEGA